MKRIAMMIVAALLAAPAMAADINIVAPAAPAPPPPAPVFSWAGHYAGVQLGYGWGSATLPYANALTCPCTISQGVAPLAGLVAGARFGVDWQWNRVVAGVIGDANWLRISGDDAGVGGDLNGVALRWSASAAGRVGVAFNRVLPYALLGYTVAGGTASNPADSEFVDGIFRGLTFGGGVEVAVSDDLSIVTEIRRINFGTTDFSLPLGGYAEAITPTVLTVTIGVNFRFGGE